MSYIFNEAGRAEFTDWFVIFDIAWCVFGTSGRLARIDALIISAGQLVRTTAVAQANRQ